MTGPELLRGVQWTFTLCGVCGVIICAYTAVDAWADLRARARLGLNGHLEIAGRIARRAAIASLGMHLGFVLLGTAALLAPLPVPTNYVRSVMIGGGFTLMQLLVVTAQVRNQLDRSSMRGLPSDKP